MELKVYLRVLARKWWLTLPIFLIAFTSTVVFTFAQRPTYEATATFVVAPGGYFENFAYGLDLLSRRSEISSTYAEVANSRLVKNLAAEELGLSPGQRESLSVNGRLLAGTNVLAITAYGNDPILVRDFANLVGDKMVLYVEDLYEAFELQPLDQATIPTSPIAPDKKLNLALGGILGLILGMGIAFLAEYLQAPLEHVANFGILDSETGAYNKDYFLQRLREEMSRANRNSYPLSLALMNVDHLGVTNSLSSQVRSEMLRQAATLVKRHLRDEDIIAHIRGTVFGFLLPDMSGEKAKETVERLQARIAYTLFEMEENAIKLNLSGTASVVTYQFDGVRHDELLMQATRALEEAEAAGYGKVYLFAENGDQPSVDDDEKGSDGK
jgi:diguanylate cyclase (GGDEF)-like protein